ncbi:MAG: hypothetical protein M3Q29_07985 [Chloroflexota bacterium]|nr:hypothetical protein [Chloroflexota bacterium]
MADLPGLVPCSPSGWFLLSAANEYDPRYLTVDWAMPIDSQGRVIELASDGTQTAIPFVEAVTQIKSGAAEAPWSAERPK